MAIDSSHLVMQPPPAFEPTNTIGFLQRRTTSPLTQAGDGMRALAHGPAMPAAVRDALSSTGQPLDSGTRGFMESRFGHDFTRVRVHTDTTAAESATSVGARAYTVGSDVVFGENEFAPETQRGRELLAHELAHTIQQRNVTGPPPSPNREDAFEKSADAAARDVLHGRTVSRELPECGFGLSRAPGQDDDRAKAIAEAQALIASIDENQKNDENDDGPAAKIPRKSTSSKFLPGGFTDKEVYKEYEEAKDRMKLADLAIALAEKQVKRREFWATNPSNNTADNERAFALDLYWDSNEQGFIRQPYVQQQEDIIRATPESMQIYRDYYDAAWEYRPPKKGLIRRVLDPPVHFICKHTNPCSGIIDQMHRDRENGVAEVDVKKNALARLTIEGAMFFAPGEGPSGPIDISKGGGPQGGSFETPAFETGTPARPEESSAPSNVPKNPLEAATTAGPTTLEASKLEPTKSSEGSSTAITTKEENAVPETISEEAVTERIREGRVGEIVGDFEIAGEKGLKGTTFERDIYGLTNMRGKQTDIGPIRRLSQDFIKEARDAGATNLKIRGHVVRNPNVMRVMRFVERLGGTVRRTGDMSIEVDIPIR